MFWFLPTIHPYGVIRGIRYRVIFSTNNAPLRGEIMDSFYTAFLLPIMHPYGVKTTIHVYSYAHFVAITHSPR